MYEIIKKNVLNSTVTLMEILAPEIAKSANPGEFVILRVDEYGERFPLTISDYNGDTGTITIIFQVVGVSTRKLNLLNVGDSILDLVGPLGVKSELDGFKKVCLVVGGVGAAIGYPILKSLRSRKTKVDVILGFRNKDLIILEEEIKVYANSFILTTDDGSSGLKAVTTTPLEELIKNNTYDEVIAIGPLRMMKAVSILTKKYNLKTIVSMNPVMVDGTGMCGGCRLRVDGVMKFACVDGPEFDASLIDFDEVISRNEMYKTIEREKDCRLLANEK